VRDPEHAPDFPEGFPGRILVYDKFCQEMDWNPRIVDELTLDEEFWLPLVKEARTAAAETLQAVTEMQQPLQHN
jgi:hypothetical protein